LEDVEEKLLEEGAKKPRWWGDRRKYPEVKRLHVKKEQGELRHDKGKGRT